MAIYHLSAKIISRKAGRSSTGAAAYRAAEKIVDERTGEIHDYSRKKGVEHTEIVVPKGVDWKPSRAELWNAAEEKNKRGDAQVAREFVVALPAELTASDRWCLAREFARHIADRYGVAADVCVHAPGRGGDSRNHHAHILTTTNRIEGVGKLGNKARELDLVAHNMGGKLGQANEIDRLRQQWESMANAALDIAGHHARVDHRTLDAQGVEREPTRHLGPSATAIERRGRMSQKRLNGQEASAASIEQQQAAVEQAAARESMLEHHQEPADVLAALLEHSPRLADEALHLQARADVDAAKPRSSPAPARKHRYDRDFGL